MPATTTTTNLPDPPPPPKRHTGLGLRPTIVEATSGLTAGFLSTLIAHPLDLIKTRLQIDRTPGPKKFGTSLRLLRSVVRDDGNGWRSLYRGLPVNVAGNMLSWGVYFLLYGDLKSRLAPPLTTPDYLLASSSAGLLTALLTNPFWVTKTRMLSTTAAQRDAYASFPAGLRHVVASGAALRGLAPALLGVTHGAVQFAIYERLKLWRGDAGGVRSLDWVLMSGAAKVAAGAVTYPYKVVQTRVQNGGMGSAAVELGGGGGGGGGVREVVVRIWSMEGVRGFYRGLGPNLVRVLPATCITFLVYENMKIYLG